MDKSNTFIKKLSAMGCNFAASAHYPEPDPEITIIQSLDYFWSDKKIFTMVIGLLKYRLHGLLNLKRLKVLASDLTPEKRQLLAVLMLKVYHYTQDIRYKNLFQELKKNKQKDIKVPASYLDDFYLERHGLDKEFRKIGLDLPDFFDIQPAKKFKTFEKIFSENLWLRLRAIAGPDYRADTLFLFKRHQASTQSQAAKILGCHRSSVSRVWASAGSFRAAVDSLDWD